MDVWFRIVRTDILHGKMRVNDSGERDIWMHMLVLYIIYILVHARRQRISMLVGDTI